jgi:hypothetical protein
MLPGLLKKFIAPSLNTLQLWNNQSHGECLHDSEGEVGTEAASEGAAAPVAEVGAEGDDCGHEADAAATVEVPLWENEIIV